MNPNYERAMTRRRDEYTQWVTTYLWSFGREKLIDVFHGLALVDARCGWNVP